MSMFIIGGVIFLTFFQDSNIDIFLGIHEIFKNTLVLSLVFYPLAIFIISLNLDSRSVSIIRYGTELNWFETMAQSQIPIILFYVLLFALISTLSIISYGLILGNPVRASSISFLYFVIDIAKLCLSLITFNNIILVLNLKISRNIKSYLFIIYVIYVVVITVEMLVFGELILLRPLSNFNISIFLNILSLGSFIIFTIIIYILCCQILREGQ